jgi:iron(III) transport system substrate-binding protein
MKRARRGTSGGGGAAAAAAACAAVMPVVVAMAVAAAAGTAAGCNDHRTPVTIYSPHGRELLALMEKSFEGSHPDIDVRWLDMGSQDVLDRVRSEAVNPQADIWYGGPRAIFMRGAAEGLLAPYRPSWAAAVPVGSRGAGDLYFGAYRTAPVLVWNSAALPAAAAPRDWDDLLAPRFKGKILMRDPLASGTLRTLFASVLARSVAETGSTDRGFAWLRQLDAQTKEYLQNPALLIQKLNRREGLVTVWELTDILWQKKRGAPLDYGFASSGTPVIDDSIGLVKGAPHAAAARAFIEFVGSAAGQELAAREALRVPARTDLPAAALPAWTRGVVAAMVPAKVDWALIESHEKEWMIAWDRDVRAGGAAAAGR